MHRECFGTHGSNCVNVYAHSEHSPNTLVVNKFTCCLSVSSALRGDECFVSCVQASQVENVRMGTQFDLRRA